MKITPIKDRIFAEKLPQETKTASGIILQNKDKPIYRAKILAIGDRVKGLNIGDVVQYYQGTGADYFHEGKDCVFLNTRPENCDIELIISNE